MERINTIEARIKQTNLILDRYGYKPLDTLEKTTR